MAPPRPQHSPEIPRPAPLFFEARRLLFPDLVKRLFFLLKLFPRVLRHAIIRYLARPDESSMAGVRVKVATTVAEYEAAARLLQTTYERHGLLAPHPSGLRVTPHLLLPYTVVFVALKGAEVIGTLSLVPDSPMGLPMDSIYSEALAPLRAKGRRLAELGALCIAPGHRKQGTSFLLNKLMWRCAKELLGLDDLVMAIHPAAQDLYQAVMGFEVIGDVRVYPGLNRSALAIPLRLDVREGEQRSFAAHGAKPYTAANPYYMYVVREHRQVEVPSDPLFAHRARFDRLQSARRMVSARPDTLIELSDYQSGNLRAALSRLFTPVEVELPPVPEAPVAA